MFGIGFSELLIILVIALIFIGPDQLPQLARTLGKSLREFRKASDEVKDAFLAESQQDKKRFDQARSVQARTSDFFDTTKTKQPSTSEQTISAVPETQPASPTQQAQQAQPVQQAPAAHPPEQVSNLESKS